MISGWALVSACLFLLVLMTGVWVFSMWLRNAGIVDVAWAFGFAPLCWIYACFLPHVGLRQLLVLVMVTVWAFRLGWYLAWRVMAHHPVEDARYTTLKERWGDQANFKMLTFFYLQGALMGVLSLVFFIGLSDSVFTSFYFEFVGCALWIFALSGETLADEQLRVFKVKFKGQDAVCERGLWRYSRHPNYFFEWLVWVSFFIYALPTPWGWTTLYAPLLMLYFLTCLTGVKATEMQALKTKGEAYRRYQQTTSAFVPWFRKTL